jgi:hypothetical protein
MVETKDDNKSVDPLVLNLLSTTGRGLKPWARRFISWLTIRFMIDISIVKWGNINQQTYLGPTSRASSIYNSGLIWLLPIKLAPMLVEFRGPPFQETPWAIPYIPFLTHHTILAFPLQWIRLDPPETHEIIMKSIIFVGENTWTSHFLSPVFVTELPPKILHETGREKVAQTSTGAQVASEFYVLLEGSGAHPGVLQWFRAFHGISWHLAHGKNLRKTRFSIQLRWFYNSFLELARQRFDTKNGVPRISEQWTATSIGVPT